MADPTTRIGAGKNRTGKSENFRFPDNVGHAGSGGQHFMLISSYIMSDPRMTTGTAGKPGGANSPGYDKLIQRSADKSYAFYIPPGSLKQQYDGKYSSLAYGGAAITAGGGTRDLVNADVFTGGGYGGGQTSFISRIQAGVSSANISKSYDSAVQAVQSGGKEASAAMLAKSGSKQIFAATGMAANQHMALVYDGPGEFRTHQFSFTFWPKNSDEAKNIKEITKNLKRSLLPGGSSTKSGVSKDIITSAFWGYPDLFQIQFFNGATEFKDMFIYRSVLKQVIVDFMGAENTIAFHKDNTPVATKMDLTFQETVHVTNQDIQL